MTAQSAFWLVGAMALAVTLALTLVVAADPAAGLARLTHRAEALPQAMAVRYAAQALLAGIALAAGDAQMLLALMLAFALVSFGDTLVYARAGHPFGPHLLAGIGAVAGAVLLLIART